MSSVGFWTPRRAWTSRETEILDVRCSTGQTDPGCVPAGFPGWKARWRGTGETADGSQGAERVGETMMPLVLDLIDQALVTHHGMISDGKPYQAFREFLIENYLNAPGEEHVTDGGDYFIKAFGAHYHEFDLTGGEWIIDLEKDADLPNWAYKVFYMDGDNPISLTSWRSHDADTIIIYPDYNQAVLVVTAYEGTYDLSISSPSAYSSSGGHYSLTETQPSYSPDVFDDGNSGTPVPGTWPSRGTTPPETPCNSFWPIRRPREKRACAMKI